METKTEPVYVPKETTPWAAIGWLLFLILLCIAPALVWAGWRWLT